MDKRELLRLKEDIEKTERQISQDEGALNQLYSDLADNGYNSVAEANKEIKRLNQEISNLEKQLDEKVQQIEEMMND